MLVRITYATTELTMAMRSRDTTDLSLEYSRLSSTAIAMIIKNKIALITDVTGQDGAYLDEFLQERAAPSTVSSGASRFSTPIELTLYQDPRESLHCFSDNRMPTNLYGPNTTTVCSAATSFRQ